MRHSIEFLGFKILLLLFRIIPFKIFYLISDFNAFILEYILKYRKKVIYKNLALAFPKYDKKQIRDIAHKSYKNLSDVFLESIKAISVSKETIQKRYIVENDDMVKSINESDKSLIFVCGHYANWEWFSFVGKDYFNLDIYGVYKLIHNTKINQIIHDNREQHGAYAIPIEKTGYMLKKVLHKPGMIGLVADQNPGSAEKSIWVDFFNIKTAVIHGPEIFAKKFNMPMYYYDVQRIKRGYYGLKFVPLCLEPKNTKEGEITSLYMSYLERVIREKPEDYLWSHKRWKKTFPEMY